MDIRAAIPLEDSRTVSTRQDMPFLAANFPAVLTPTNMARRKLGKGQHPVGMSLKTTQKYEWGAVKRDRERWKELEDKELVEKWEEEIKQGAEREDLQEVLQIRVTQRARKIKILPRHGRSEESTRS